MTSWAYMRRHQRVRTVAGPTEGQSFGIENPRLANGDVRLLLAQSGHRLNVRF